MPVECDIVDGPNLKRPPVYFDYITQRLAVDTISSLWNGEKKNLKVKKNREISLDLLAGRPAGRAPLTQWNFTVEIVMTPTPREPRFLFFSMCVSQIQDFGYETALERILELLAGGIRSGSIFIWT